MLGTAFEYLSSLQKLIKSTLYCWRHHDFTSLPPSHQDLQILERLWTLTIDEEPYRSSSCLAPAYHLITHSQPSTCSHIDPCHQHPPDTSPCPHKLWPAAAHHVCMVASCNQRTALPPERYDIDPAPPTTSRRNSQRDPSSHYRYRSIRMGC